MKMKLSKVIILFKKEIVDLIRDYKTLLAIIILPLLGLPGLAIVTGVLSQSQTITICIEDLDNTSVSKNVVGRIVNETRNDLLSQGFSTYIVWGTGEAGQCDIQVRVPRGFSNYLLRLDGSASIVVSSSLTVAGQQAYTVLQGKAESVSRDIVLHRIQVLAEEAGETVNPENLTKPIRVVLEYHTVSGAKATQRQVLASEASRVLEFSLFFVVNPAVVFMSDSIVGERERRTLEILLISPLSRGEILAGKTLAGLVVGLVGAVADSFGIAVFFLLSGFNLAFTLELAALWISVAVGLIIFSSMLTATISARAGSVRSAQNTSFLATMTALLVYFAALAVDYSKLGLTAKVLLMLVPFSYGALSLNYYAVGAPRMAVVFVALLYASSVVAGILASRSLNTERLLAS
jgi:ABC-2 type transport system permease protein